MIHPIVPVDLQFVDSNSNLIMKPTFIDQETWEKTNVLMQPAFIRLLDNIRKLTDELSSWKSGYVETLVWDEAVSPEERGRIGLLQQELKTTINNDRAYEIEQILETLPKPYPAYEWKLERNDEVVMIDVWELCYKICFTADYDPRSDRPSRVDDLLFDEDEVDWTALDEKAKRLVVEILSQLPTLS
jgi:hypothetical protein